MYKGDYTTSPTLKKTFSDSKAWDLKDQFAPRNVCKDS